MKASFTNKTTYPPTVYNGSPITSALTLSPTVTRDTSNTPDIGYHYYALDYAFGGATASATITVNPGTVVGWFRTSSGWYHAGYGIHLYDGQLMNFTGTVERPCYWVRCNVVQEGANGGWAGGYGPGGIDGWASTVSVAPEVRGTFLKCSMLDWEANNHFRDDYGMLKINMANSEFFGGSLGGYVHASCYTNCLFERMTVGVVVSDATLWINYRNVTMKGCDFSINRSYASSVLIHDCVFDETTISTSDSYSSNPTYTDYNYNAYGDANRLTPVGSGNVIVSSFGWQTGSLGSYYLPSGSTLINAGSRTAAAAGLYHFTTQTSQAKEASTQVDMGYHYVALSNGLPVDSNGDGIGDYLQDSNGNGVVDSGEVNWQTIVAPAFQIWITKPRNGASY